MSFYARLNHPKRRHQTTPEELLAAAFATDFAMVLAVVLAEAGHVSQHTAVAARCAVERIEEGGYRLSGITLEVRAEVLGLSQEEFEHLAQAADEICPISVGLRGNVPVSVSAILEEQSEYDASSGSVLEGERLDILEHEVAGLVPYHVGV